MILLELVSSFLLAFYIIPRTRRRHIQYTTLSRYLCGPSRHLLQCVGTKLGVKSRTSSHAYAQDIGMTMYHRILLGKYSYQWKRRLLECIQFILISWIYAAEILTQRR